ncbi:MAG: tRNA (guanosine(46)-N7)-methyltransferase TrmB [Firmicutes bacterium]|nr:tRNA (guanosine(46)-N7)-methyltransferase TrmB [Bacillota bacterium]
MRQRKVKNEAEKLAAVAAWSVPEPKSRKGRWAELFPGKDLYLELGCGRGHFLVGHAQTHPENAYIGAEYQGSVALRAMELIRDSGVPNALCMVEQVLELSEYFDAGELSGIYLNFSDPWPKARHEKRRLTHRRYLEAYRTALKPGGFVEIKTDNDDLFAFTLEEIKALELNPEELSFDLHGSDFPAKNITTQYEEKFKALGKTINYCRIRF